MVLVVDLYICMWLPLVMTGDHAKTCTCSSLCTDTVCQGVLVKLQPVFLSISASYLLTTGFSVTCQGVFHNSNGGLAGFYITSREKHHENLTDLSGL